MMKPIELERKPSDDEPLSAMVFKLQTDPFVGQLSYCRVYSGILEAGSYVLNARTGSKERIGRVVLPHANERKEVKKVFSGEICAIIGLKDSKTSDTLCDEKAPIELIKIVFPNPVIELRIEPKTKPIKKNSVFHYTNFPMRIRHLKSLQTKETGETKIAGMGELHLEIIVDRLKREFGVQTNVGTPQVAYRETIRGSSDAEIKYIKQTGGRGQYGHVKIKVAPINKLTEEEIKSLPKNVKRTGSFEFINNIKGGVIPQEYIPACEKGMIEAMARGVYASYPMVDISVDLYDGSYHDVDSSEIAFKIASSQAFQDATKKAGIILLEPIMKLEVTVPEEFMGDVSGDISSRRGHIEKMEDIEQAKILKALVPLSEIFGYTTALRSMTSGRGSNTMEFSHYAEVPTNIAEEVVKNRTGK